MQKCSNILSLVDLEEKRWLKNQHLDEKIEFDTVENGPSKIWVTNIRPLFPPGSNKQLWKLSAPGLLVVVVTPVLVVVVVATFSMAPVSPFLASKGIIRTGIPVRMEVPGPPYFLYPKKCFGGETSLEGSGHEKLKRSDM